MVGILELEPSDLAVQNHSKSNWKELRIEQKKGKITKINNKGTITTTKTFTSTHSRHCQSSVEGGAPHRWLHCAENRTLGKGQHTTPRKRELLTHQAHKSAHEREWQTSLIRRIRGHKRQYHHYCVRLLLYPVPGTWMVLSRLITLWFLLWPIEVGFVVRQTKSGYW